MVWPISLISRPCRYFTRKGVDAAVASLVLHNMLRTKSRDSYTPPDAFDEEIDGNTVIPGSWREDGGFKVL